MNDELKEILHRSRRMETRLHVMCQELNISGGYEDRNKCFVRMGKDGLIEVRMTAADISLSTVKKAITSAGFDPVKCGEVMLFHNDDPFGSVLFD